MIVVFGTINVDLVTEVTRFAVPGETIKGPDYQIFPGGKGANQALAAARAGARVSLVGAVGSDEFATVALGNVLKAGIDCTRVRSSHGRTGIAMIAIGPDGDHMMLGANAANDTADAGQLAGLLGPGVTFLLQNSLGITEVEAAIAMARTAGARIIYNAAPAEPVAGATLLAADVFVVNEHEARGYGELLDLPADPAMFARAFAERYSCEVVVTLGGRGLVAMVEGRLLRGEPVPVEVVDTTGAGDAFCGALGAALDRGDDLETAIGEGMAAGSLACRVAGAQSSYRDLAEIRALATRIKLVPV